MQVHKPHLAYEFAPKITSQLYKIPINIKTVINIIGKSSVQFLLTFGIYLSYILYKYFRIPIKSEKANFNTPHSALNHQVLFLLITLPAIFCSIITYAFFFDMIDGEQLFYSSGIFANTIIVVFGYKLTFQKSYLLFIVIAIVSLFNLSQIYNFYQKTIKKTTEFTTRNFQETLKKISDKELIIANMNSKKHYINPFSMESFCNIPMELIIPGRENTTQIIELTLERGIEEIDSLKSKPFSKNTPKSLFQQSIWFNYLCENKIKLDSIDTSKLISARLKFIKEHQIKYIYVDKDDEISFIGSKLKQIGKYEVSGKILYSIDN